MCVSTPWPPNTNRLRVGLLFLENDYTCIGNNEFSNMTKTFSTKTAGVGLTAVYKEKFAAKTIHASSCNILRMIFLALGVDGFHRNQCIRVIMQQEFARELREISSVFAFWC